MIDERDIEIAKLRGQVEALEKMVRQLMIAPPAPVIQPIPQLVPYVPPPPAPWIPNVQPWQPWQPYEPFWTTCCGGLQPGLVFTNAPGTWS